MRYRTILTLACAALLGCASTVALASPRATISGKPVYDQEVLPVVETSLSKMWDAADAVLEVRIAASEVKGIGTAPYLRVRTFHSAAVTRVLKGDLKAGARIVFSQAAGQLELADRILRVEGAEALTSGDDTFIVFLRKHDAFGPWILLGERSGAFKIHGGHIQPQGFGAVAEEQRDVSARQFSDELDRIARRRPKG